MPKKQSNKENTEIVPKQKNNLKSNKKPSVKRIRVPVTPDSYDASIQATLDDIDAEIDRLKKSTEKTKGVKFLRSIRKDLVGIQKKARRLVKNKRTTSKKGTGKSGFDKKCNITKEMADFLQVDQNTQFSRLDATRAICVYIHYDTSAENSKESERWSYLNKNGKRNLQNPQNRRIVIPDEKLADLLHYEQYRKDVKAGKVLRKDKKTGKIIKVTDDKLYYYVVNKLVQIHFIKEEKVV